jgi:hypothetical protein
MDMLGLDQSGSSANTANRGGCGNGGGRGYNGSRGGGRGYNGGGRGNGGRGNFNNNQRQGSNGGDGHGGFFNKNSIRGKPVVRCASRKDILRIGVGTGLRRIMFLKRSMCRRL